MAEWSGGSGVAIVCDGLTAAGKAVLVKAIKRAGWQESQFYVARSDDVPMGARAVVACGDSVLKALTGWEGGKRAVKYTRGYLLPSWGGWPVVPTFDPSKVALGQMKLLGLVMNDIGVAMQAACGARQVCADPRSTIDASVGIKALRELRDQAHSDPLLPIAFDLETATSWDEDEDEVIELSRDDEEEGESEQVAEPSLSRDALDIAKAEIHTVQFSLNPRSGVSADWDNEVQELSAQLLAMPNPKLSWNGFLFDSPILLNHSVATQGHHDDAMWCFKWLQPDLPAHLQGVAVTYGALAPWKHIAGSDLAWYGVADVANLQLLWQKMPRALQRLGLWDAYCRYVRNFRPLIAEMEQRGIPVSRAKLSELRLWLESEIGKFNGELQIGVPGSLKGRKYWKTWPADTKELMGEYKRLLASEIEIDLLGQGKKVTKKALSVPVKIKDMVNPMLGYAWKAKVQELGYEFEGDQLYKELDFNPRSSQQILAYLKARNYPIPKKFKDGSETTADKGLEALEAKTKDPVIRLTRSIRAYGKLANGYTGKTGPDGEVIGGWQPGPDGRLRATITFKSTGQLAAHAPNTMTLPKRRKELAQKFRECIEAPAGYKMIEFDYKAFHSLTTALESRDKVMYRLAPLDPHSFVAGHMVKFPGIETCLDMSDGDLLQYLSEIKKRHKSVRDFQAKPAGHAVNFRASAKRLYFEYSEHFENEAAAKRLFDLMKALFPNLFAWQERVIQEADDNGHLVSKWGAIRWFFDAMKWERSHATGRWERKASKGAPAAVAFRPSNDAHIMLREKMLLASEQGWDVRFGLVNSVHDALWWLCPDGLVEECLEVVPRLLEAPVVQLADEVMCPGGFVCRVDRMVGQNLGVMEEVK